MLWVGDGKRELSCFNYRGVDRLTPPNHCVFVLSASVLFTWS
nr:unnamed protein product [Callosobruchus chinensis]